MGRYPLLLCLTFDDVADYSDLGDGPSVARFTPAMARQILRHVGHGKWPVLIQFTEGVSRSGAIGLVLDHYWNQVWEKNPADHEAFVRMNPQIDPNPLVEAIFTDFIEGGDDGF